MNNEPVAWIKQNPETLEAELHFDKPAKYWSTVVSNPDIPLYTHPVKELHLSLQKSKQTGELLAVTYTDDEHRIVEVLWEKPPELTDEEIIELQAEYGIDSDLTCHSVKDFVLAILRKAQEK